MSYSIKAYEISVTGGGKSEALIISYKKTRDGPWNSIRIPRDMMFIFMETINREWERSDRFAEAYL